MTRVGAPAEPEVWRWYYNTVGKGEAVIVGTWWQTETGGFLCSTVPGMGPMKPGSARPAIPRIHPVIYGDHPNEIPQRPAQARRNRHQHPRPAPLHAPP